ncbi:MAG: choice-of-anchor J domain-containing protein [Crocinitomicaceae bacterium]
MRIILIFTLVLVTRVIGQTYLINEDFQTGLPGSFQNIKNDTGTVHPNVSEFTEAWIIKENPDSIGDSVIASTSWYQYGGIASRWLITQQLQLGAYGNFIEWDVKSHDPSFSDGYTVLVSTTNDSLHNFTDTLFYTDFELPTWTTREIQLADSTYGGQQIYLAFVHDSEDQYILYLDNIKVRTEDPLSVDEFPGQSKISSVYPNPFTKEIRVQTDFEITNMYLLNFNGQVVRELNGEHYSLTSLDELEFGIYFLHIRYKNGLEERKKLIKGKS